MKISSSFKPYIIHAFYIWALENQLTPFVHIYTDTNNHVEDNDYILKMHPESIRNLIFAKDFLAFNTLINNSPTNFHIQYSQIKKIYCHENSYGFLFDNNDSITEIPSTKTISPFKVIDGGLINPTQT